MFEIPTKNFYSRQLRKRHHFWWASQTNFGSSYFVRTLAIHQWRSSMFVTWDLLPGNPAFFCLPFCSAKQICLTKLVVNDMKDVDTLCWNHFWSIPYHTLDLRDMFLIFKSIINMIETNIKKSKNKNVSSEFISTHWKIWSKLIFIECLQGVSY